MVRKTPEVRGNDGALVVEAQVVPGDVTLPLMALEPDRFDIDVVIHCAACLEFDASRELLAAVNVEGTRNAVEFARAAGAGFIHVSTAYTCGTREGVIAEEPVPAGTRFTNNYEESKALAEAVVAQSGVPFAIARPSIVLGDHADGAIRDFPSLCNVFRLMARGKVSVFPAQENATLDLVPLCHVAEGIARIAQQFDAAQGGYFHLVASEPTRAAELAYGVARVDHFPDPEVVAPSTFDPITLRPAERLLLRRMLDTFGAYFTRNPQFDDTRFRALTGLACPPTDRGWLDRMIAYGIERRYLPPPPTSQQPVSERRDNASPAVPERRSPTASRP